MATTRRSFFRNLGASGIALGYNTFPRASAAEPIKVGIMHSLSGTMAISETSLRDVELMAVEEINAKGGVARPQGGGGCGRPRFGLAYLRGEE